MSNYILICSVLNPPNIPLSYSKIRSVFSREERFEQTKNTIKTVKEKIPNTKIILVECTDFNENEYNYLNKECEHILNLWDRKELHPKIFGHSKALGEATQMIEIIDYISKNINLDHIIKIGGRYWLNDNFNFENFKDDIVFKKNHEGNVATTLYKISLSELKLLREYFIANEDKMRRFIGYEILVTQFLSNKNVKYLETLGISGHCTVNGEYYSF